MFEIQIQDGRQSHLELKNVEIIFSDKEPRIQVI